MILLIIACDQLNEVIHELPDFTEWRALGLNLGLVPGQLDEIEVNYKLAHDRLNFVLLEWLQMKYNQDKHGPPTWNNLVNSLEQIDHALSISIHKKHCTTVPL